MDAAEAAGLRGFWMGYFAQRAAPLGAVGPAPVSAACYGFHPARVARALPDAWDYIRPEEALQLRRRAAAAALDPLWRDTGDLLLKTAVGEIEPETLRVARGFDEQQWSSTQSDLRACGWIDGHARLTESGTQEHQRIEDDTDAAAAQPWSMLSDDQQRELCDWLAPLSRAVLDAQILPPLNPVGLGRTD